jgi:hypothetical protein
MSRIDRKGIGFPNQAVEMLREEDPEAAAKIDAWRQEARKDINAGSTDFVSAANSGVPEAAEPMQKVKRNYESLLKK